MKRLAALFLGAWILVYSSQNVTAEEYDATVTTDSGTYSVPVEVEDGEVTEVHWPNGGRMSVSDAELDGSSADGTTMNGDSVHIEVED
jgi:Zn-dependent membrane protease YugP